ANGLFYAHKNDNGKVVATQVLDTARTSFMFDNPNGGVFITTEADLYWARLEATKFRLTKVAGIAPGNENDMYRLPGGRLLISSPTYAQVVVQKPLALAKVAIRDASRWIG